jgi:hypothetical protein
MYVYMCVCVCVCVLHFFCVTVKIYNGSKHRFFLGAGLELIAL